MLDKNPKSNYTIKISDCDIMGHLNNVKYLEYFINARESHLLEAYNIKLTDYIQNGIGWVVANHQINYLKPVKYYDTICITSCLIKAIENELIMEAKMFDENQTSLKAILWTTFIPVSVSTGKKINHPEAFMSFAKDVLIENEIYNLGLLNRTNQIVANLKK
jgi:YbgC/YbaW family acyl-CoA thioester hydrolase